MRRPDWASRDVRTTVIVLSVSLVAVLALGAAAAAIALTAGGFL